MSDLSRLDSPELLHLALEAAGRDDHGAAISYLKQAVDLPAGEAASSTDYAKLVYMLGAEYAQIGMMDRAQENMARAVELDPGLHTARLQLGLLLLTQAQPQRAAEMLAPLQALGNDSPFAYFANGLMHLIRDEVADCRTAIERGMQLNAAHPRPNLALNDDMRKLLAALPGADGAVTGQVGAAVSGALGSPAAEEAEGSAEASFNMSAYNKGSGRPQ